MLAPALTVVGNEVSSVGSSVTSTTGNVGQALQSLGTVTTSATHNVGEGSAPNILGAV